MIIQTKKNVDAVKRAVKAMDVARNALYEVEMSIVNPQTAYDLIVSTQTELEERAEALEKLVRVSS